MTRDRRAPVSVALLVACLAAPPAVAQDPAPDPAPPGFSAPTEITNPWAPFTPESVKIHFGRDSGARTVTLERQLEQTRTFHLEGTPVEARILQESEFIDGVLEEITVHYLAQDDAGNVRYFGEVAQEYDGGVVVGTEPDSWMVTGPPQADDPAGVHIVRQPAMYMPAQLELGTSFEMEAAPGHSEIITVVAMDEEVQTPAGEFTGVVKLQEDGEDDGGTGIVIQYRWVAPGVGAVREDAPGSRSALVATSLAGPELDTEAVGER